MAHPVNVYCDFDGVLNTFPDLKMLRRGGQTRLDWMKPEDPRRSLYSLDNAFLLDHTEHVRAKGQMWRIKWAGELAQNLHQLMLDGRIMFHWLSTWQPWTASLDSQLGFTGLTDTIHWYDPQTNQGILTGKFHTIRIAAEKHEAPIIWLDDEECYETPRLKLETLQPSQPILMIRTDQRIGISRKQWQHINRFISDPNGFTGVTLDEEPSIHEHKGHTGL